MAPLDIDTALEWRGRTIVDRDGEKIGKLNELYLDESDRPAWGAVTTGLFGRRQSFVPLADLRPAGDDLQVPYEKDRVKDAPNVDPDEQLSGEEEEVLHRHYGIARAAPAAAEPDERTAPDVGGDEREAPRPEPDAGGDEREAPRPEPDAGRAQAEREAPRHTDGGDESEAPGRTADGVDESEARRRTAGGGDEDGAEMIRSEEEVDVSTRRRVRGKARLKKYVVTEHVTKVVPVQREEVRVEFDPAGDDAEQQAAGEDVARGAPPQERASTD
jgi:hypothetical protein